MLAYLRSAVLGVAALGSLATGSVAHAEWWEAETSHFIIISESSKDDVERFASRLERFDNALRYMQRLPIPGPDVGQTNKVRVYRYGDTDDIGRLFGSGGGGVAGFYIPRAGGAVSFVPTKETDPSRFDRNLDRRQINQRSILKPESILFHEYVHHFMLQKFSTAYPHWYTEGFAELYATVDLGENGSFKVGDVPQHRAQELFQLPDVRLTKLFDHTKELSGIEVFQSYSFGWMLAHYLNFNAERKGQLPQYLKALNAGEDSLTAAKRVFGDLDKLQKELSAYKKGPFPGYEIIPANYVAPTVSMRRLSAGEEAVIKDHIRSERGVNERQARSVVLEMGGKELAYPDNLAVQLMASEAYLDTRDFDKAEATLKRALKIDPESQDAQVMMGSLFVSRAEAEKDLKLYAQARPFFAEAYRLDPKDPRAAIGYYMTYYRAKEAAPEPALIALESVFDYAAYDAGYRLILARQLLDENKLKGARSVLAPLAFSAHKQAEANKVAQIIEEIDAGKIQEARTTMATIFAEGEKKGDD